MTEFFDTRPAEKWTKQNSGMFSYTEGDFLAVIDEITEIKQSKNKRSYYRQVHFTNVEPDGVPVALPSLFLNVEIVGQNNDFCFSERGQERFNALCNAIGMRTGDRVSKDEFLGAPLKVKVTKTERGSKTYWNVYTNPCNKMEQDIVLGWKRAKSR